MNLIFPPIFRYVWAALAALSVLAFLLLRSFDASLIAELPFSENFILALACLFLFLTIMAKEKTEDERLVEVRGRSFAQTVIIGVLFGMYCAFFPSEDMAVFQSSAALMVYLQTSYLLNFHARKRKDQ